MLFDYTTIPPLVLESILRYRDEGCPTGSFTRAVLSGDLYDAVRRADDDSLAALPTIAAFIENNLPIAAFSTPEHYKAWMMLFDDLRRAGNTNVRYNHETRKLTYEEPLRGGEETTREQLSS